MPKQPSLLRRVRYAFDNTLARGPIALVFWLFIVTILLVVLAVAIDLWIGGVTPDLQPREVFWNILFQALVPNPPGDFKDSPWQFIIVMLVVTLCSLIIVSILIGLLSAGIQSRIDRLRRGRSQVIEHNHTVILGWSEQVFVIIHELIVANANQRQSAIAILGDRDQVEMEDEIRHRIRDTGRTRVVCRRGSPTEHADLDLVSPQTSKSIIILPDDGEEGYPDATTIKTILALTKAPDRRPEPYQIVTELRADSNEEVARLVGNGEVELVLSGELIAKIMAQTSRQAGLSIVYTDLFDFEGDEIYFQQEPQLAGKTYGEALMAYEDSAVMGLRTAGGQVLINPPPETVIGAEDRIIAIAQDDDTVRLSGLNEAPVQREAMVTAAPAAHAPERVLILGWNWRGVTIIEQMDAYVAPASQLTVVAAHPTVEQELAALQPGLTNLTLTYRRGEISSRPLLEALKLYEYDHVIILAYSDALDAQRADAVTLLALLHVRKIADDHSHAFSVVSEMMDVRNRDLAQSGRADDFIVSDRLVSLIMTQISENRELNVVFNELLDPVGPEIFLKPAADYVKLGAAVTFYTVVEAARLRGETALGYRLLRVNNDAEHAFGVVLNPKKSALVTFGEGDRVIVLAEN